MAAVGVEEAVVKKAALETRLLLLRKRLRYEPRNSCEPIATTFRYIC